jgi:hypothetical protein
MTYTGGKVISWQNKFRKKLLQLVGGFPSEKCDLKPARLWKREHPLGTVEKVVFQSEPFADVLAYVCLPKNVKPPYTFFICLQGHTTGMHHSIGVEREDEEKVMAVAGDRDFGLQCMKRGMAAICIEQRSFGLRREQKQKKVSTYGCHDAAMHALMLGKTLLGERVYDVSRAIDYLEWRGDADMKRVGIMGNSGGGTISLFSAALLPKISFAMPSCYFCTFKDSIMSIYHCADNYVPGLLKYAEMWDIAGLIAPRPLVIVAGKEDPIFPISAVRRSFSNVKLIYEAADASDMIKLVVGSEGHRFYADAAWPVAQRMFAAK